MKRSLWFAIASTFILLLSALITQAEKKGIEFTDVRTQTEEFIGYYHSIKLTPEQENIKKEALSKIPAPCCKEFTQATCCCPCNLAKSVWGLSNYLIAKEDYDAARLKEAALEWIHFINKDGYDGNSCNSGRCPSPFREGGCGGMSESHIAH